MSRWATAIVVGILGLFAGYWLASERNSGQAQDEAGGEPEILYWVAPMDPNYRRDGPGKSPMGMDLVPVYADEAGADDAVRISPALEASLGVRSEPVQRRPLWRKVEATGYVGFDETRISHVNLRTEGWVVSLAVSAEGERVAAGDLLFEVYSPELVNAQKEYLQALARDDRRLADGAREKLRALGMIASEIDTLGRSGRASERIKIVAPRDGVVTDLAVREGMYLQPNSTALSLASLGSVWLLAEVFESQAPWVAEGQAAEARLDYLPGTVFSGSVDYVYPILDPRTRNLRVRLRFDNAGELLKPNMYARVSIYGKLRPQALAVPREALIRGAKRDRVVVALGEGRFRVREVLTGLESGDWVEIVGGLQEGDQVVTSAQFLIDSEASLAGSIVRLDPAHAESGPDQPVSAVANGWIEEIDAGQRRMRVAHGPIDELGWPAMNMVFEVEPQVDLGAFDVGQHIRFQLRQTETGTFVITIASPRDAADESLTPERLEGLLEDQGGTAQAGTGRRDEIGGEGEIVWVRPGENRLRMRHGPVAALDWPAMTMNFDLDEGVGLEGLEEGDRVYFTLRRKGQSWVIDGLRRAAAGDAEGSGHGGGDHGAMDHEGMDHGAMDHGSMDHEGMDHGGMDHGTMDHEGMDHEGMDHGAMNHEGMDHGAMDHGAMDHEGMNHDGIDHGTEAGEDD